MNRLGVVAVDGLCRPFDAGRHGYLAAEGAAACVIESAEHAAARGVEGDLRVAGWHSTCDAFHISKPDPTGAGAWAAIEGALGDAQVASEAVVCYGAHGTGTRVNDEIEAQLVRRHMPTAPIMATKAVTGHPFGASAAMETVLTVLAARHRTLPPVVGFERGDESTAGVDIVREPRPWEPGPVVNAAFGLGGVNTAVVLTPP